MSHESIPKWKDPSHLKDIVGVGTATNPGKRYGKLNQDRMGYFLNSKGEMVFSVFDGHSLHGEVAAEVERSVFSSRNQVEEHELKLKEAFRQAHDDIVRKYPELTEAKIDGKKYQLSTGRVNFYVNKKTGRRIVQDFGTTAVLVAVRPTPPGSPPFTRTVSAKQRNLPDSSRSNHKPRRSTSHKTRKRSHSISRSKIALSGSRSSSVSPAHRRKRRHTAHSRASMESVHRSSPSPHRRSRHNSSSANRHASRRRTKLGRTEESPGRDPSRTPPSTRTSGKHSVSPPSSPRKTSSSPRAPGSPSIIRTSPDSQSVDTILESFDASDEMFTPTSSPVPSPTYSRNESRSSSPNSRPPSPLMRPTTPTSELTATTDSNSSSLNLVYDHRKIHSLPKSSMRREDKPLLSPKSEAPHRSSSAGARPSRKRNGPAPPLFKFSRNMRAEFVSNNPQWDILCSSVGDSVAFLVHVHEDGVFVDTDLTVRHGVLNASELTRVIKSGSLRAENGYIRPPPTSGFSNNRLAMTRALGHKYFAKYGVIPRPHTYIKTVSNDCKYLVLCSDGISDVMNPRVIYDTMKTAKFAKGNLDKLADAILERAMAAWKKYSRLSSNEVEADNATIIIVDLVKLVENFPEKRE